MLEMQLCKTDKKFGKQVMEYRDEFIKNGENKIPGSGGLHHDDSYEKYLSKVEYMKTADDGILVPSIQYFAVVDGKIVGSLQIRRKLNDELIKYGGNIGYGVRPSERGKGYATKMLSLALEICREAGFEKVLLTCDKDNTSSAKTIIKNGGVLENEILSEHTGNIIQRYWIILN